MAKMSRLNCVTITILIISMIVGYMAAEYMSTDDNQDDLDYYGIMLANLINTRQFLPDKRSCLRRGAPCDHRPNDCCPQSICRCNLWGTNCRCHRMGLFQKIGKK